MDKMERQLALEEEMGNRGVLRYLAQQEGRPTSGTPHGVALLRSLVEPAAAAMRARFDAMTAGKVGRDAAVIDTLAQFKPEVLAYVGVSVCMNSDGVAISTVATTIGRQLEADADYRLFSVAAPDVLRGVESWLTYTGADERRRKVVLGLARRRNGAPSSDWGRPLMLRIGMFIVESLVSGTGLWDISLDWVGKRNRPRILRSTPKYQEWLAKNRDAIAALHPMWYPMLVPPKPWAGVRDGGYYTRRVPVVRRVAREYLEEIANTPEALQEVYAALNAAQGTAWKINRQVLDVAQTLINKGLPVAKLPSSEPAEIPSRLADGATEEQIKENKVLRLRAHRREDRRKPKRRAVELAIGVAQKFRDEEELYFAYSMDWRGRHYPLAAYLNPHGADLSKALLCFAHGKPLGEQGALWLQVHLANTYGVDKVSFDDRLAWTRENHSNLIEAAMDPLGNTWWHKADSPFQFLAACFAYLGYTLEGPSYVCHVHVDMDGTCNGLQHYSAMLLDEVGGAATNLVPQDKPADVYSEVAAVASSIVDADAAAGVPEAKEWVGKINRKLAKRNTMTTPYGVTFVGMRSQLLQTLDEMEEEGGIELDGNEKTLTLYLAKVMGTAIRSVVVAAGAAMDWLRAVSGIMSKVGLPLNWTAPSGMPIQQNYRVLKDNRVEVRYMGKAIRFVDSVETKKINSRRQGLGIAPNYVHSCDAAHLSRTILACSREGITDLAMVHDSFGTHACDAGTLAAILREQFVEQYRKDVLGEFRKEIETQLRSAGFEKEADSLPPVPKRGNLDLEQVLESQYIFA